MQEANADDTMSWLGNDFNYAAESSLPEDDAKQSTLHQQPDQAQIPHPPVDQAICWSPSHVSSAASTFHSKAMRCLHAMLFCNSHLSTQICSSHLSQRNPLCNSHFSTRNPLCSSHLSKRSAVCKLSLTHSEQMPGHAMEARWLSLEKVLPFAEKQPAAASRALIPSSWRFDSQMRSSGIRHFAVAGVGARKTWNKAQIESALATSEIWYVLHI